MSLHVTSAHERNEDTVQDFEFSYCRAKYQQRLCVPTAVCRPNTTISRLLDDLGRARIRSRECACHCQRFNIESDTTSVRRSPMPGRLLYSYRRQITMRPRVTSATLCKAQPCYLPHLFVITAAADPIRVAFGHLPVSASTSTLLPFS